MISVTNGPSPTCDGGIALAHRSPGYVLYKTQTVKGATDGGRGRAFTCRRYRARQLGRALCRDFLLALSWSATAPSQ